MLNIQHLKNRAQMVYFNLKPLNTPQYDQSVKCKCTKAWVIQKAVKIYRILSFAEIKNQTGDCFCQK